MNWRRGIRRVGLGAIDAALAAVAFALAYMLRIDFAAPGYGVYLGQCLALAGWVAALHVGFYLVFQLYRGVTRFAGLRETFAIAQAATASAGVLFVFNLIYQGRVRDGMAVGPRIPWSIIPLTWMLAVALTSGARYGRRLLAEGRLWRQAGGKGVLIVGAGARGELVARELRTPSASGRCPVGFIDDNPDLHGRSIHGLPIFGGLEAIERALETTGAEEIIVALPAPSPRQMKEIADRCGHSHVAIQRLPSAEEVLDGQVALQRLRPVKIEDLLAREPARLDLAEKDNYLRGERVLVTGAGGSIGSELSRQILRCAPQWLGLLGHGENSLYEIASDLGCRSGDGRMDLILADIQNERKMREVFRRFRPTIVFHAAAHKHVPFGEAAPDEVVRNNVFGTLYTARAAIECGAKKFILVSTDKAVRPVSVMGAAKRVAEKIAAALDAQGKTEFLAVRFGNVLGSRGSVVPLFLKQIHSGGPLTVTDSEMSRYFMTVAEAASLVVHAGAVGKRGQILVLEMGEPVRIADLARNLITLSGLRPEIDIAIEYTGARPGEKISEELLAGGGLEKTDSPKILSLSAPGPDYARLERQLVELEDLVETGEADAVRKAVFRLAADEGEG